MTKMPHVKDREPKKQTDLFGRPLKKIFFRVTEEDHHNFKLKLQYDKITQLVFYRACYDWYLKDDPLMRELVDRISKRNLHEKENVKKDKKEEEITKKNWALDEDELENIYDILEQQFPELK